MDWIAAESFDSPPDAADTPVWDCFDCIVAYCTAVDVADFLGLSDFGFCRQNIQKMIARQPHRLISVTLTILAQRNPSSIA